MKKEKEIEVYFRDIFKLLQRVPCPIDPREGFREHASASNYPNPDHAIEWAKVRREELYERAEKGVGALPDEKLRAVWLCTGYNNDRAPLDYLESRGVAVINRIDGGGGARLGRTRSYGDQTQFGRKLSPLEEVARETLNNIWIGLGPRWVDGLVAQAKDLSCDFVINFIQSGCLQIAGLAQIVDESLEREGITSFRIEGRSLFTEGYDRDDVISRFADFVDMMLRKKGIPRQ
ncbi:MAG: 2-hydroxyacyl-CoA dehydratase [Chloroflexi bacterium]|nr:2-hydroxyacyl-CoA dehydratase [Chloroflexota bacterium]